MSEEQPPVNKAIEDLLATAPDETFRLALLMSLVIVAAERLSKDYGSTQLVLAVNSAIQLYGPERYP